MGNPLNHQNKDSDAATGCCGGAGHGKPAVEKAAPPVAEKQPEQAASSGCRCGSN